MKLRLPLALASVVIASLSTLASAASYTWSGSASSDINTAANWTTSGASWASAGTDEMILNDSASANKALTANANMGLSGITVAADGYSLVGATSGLELNFNNTSGTVLNIQNNFSLGSSTSAWKYMVNNDLTWNVATGATLSMYGKLNGGSGKTISITGGKVVFETNLPNASYAGNWSITGNSVVHIYDATTTSNTIAYMGTGKTFLDAGSTLIIGRADGRMSKEPDFKGGLSGTGTLELYLPNPYDASFQAWVIKAQSFNGTVKIKAGVIGIEKHEWGNDATIVFSPGTTMRLRNNVSGWGTLPNDIYIEGGSPVTLTNYYTNSGSANTLTKDFVGAFRSIGTGAELLVNGSISMAVFTGDWSEFGGKYTQGGTARGYFKTGGSVYLTSLNTSGYGVRFIDGTLIVGSDGVTGSDNLRIGNNDTGPDAFKNKDGVVTLGGTASFKVTNTQGILLCTANSALTINTNQWDAATKNFTSTGLSVSVEKAIKGDGKLIITGAGTAVLGAAGTFSGGTTIGGGTVILGNATALGTGAVSVTGNTLLGATTTLALANAITVDASAALGINASSYDTSAGSFTASAAHVTLNGGLVGSGTLLKSGAGNLIVKGTNTFSGDIYLQQGVLYLNESALENSGTLNVLGNSTLWTDASSAKDVSIGAGVTFKVIGQSDTGSKTSSPVSLAGGTISFNGTGSLELDNASAAIAAGQNETGTNLKLVNKSVFDVNGALTLTGLVRVDTGSTLNVSGTLTATTSTANDITLGAYNTGSSTTSTLNVLNGGTFNAVDAVVRLSTWASAGVFSIKAGGTATVKGIDMEGWGGRVNIDGTLNLGSSGIRVKSDGRNNKDQIGQVFFNQGKISFTDDSSYFLAGAASTHDSTGYFTLGNADGTTRTIEVASGKTAEMNGVINGAGGFIKAGDGTLKLNKNNTYTGDTDLQAGTLLVGAAYTNAASFVLNSTTNGVLTVAGELSTDQVITATAGNTAGKVTALTINGGTLKYTAPVSGTFGGFKAINIDSLDIDGTGKMVFHFVSDAAALAGSYDLVNLGTGLTATYLDGTKLDASYYTLQGVSTTGTRYAARIETSNSAKTLSLVIEGVAGELNWNTVGTGIWKVYEAADTIEYWEVQNTVLSGGNYFFNGDTVNFVDLGGSQSIEIKGSVEPAEMTFSANTDSYTLTGTGKIVGSGKLLKTGTGELKIYTTNEYTGGTEISAGTVVLGAAGALGTGNVSLSGGAVLEFAANTLDSVSAVAVSEGTLRWGTGVTQAIFDKLSLDSSSKVTFDTNGNDVTLANALTVGGVTYTKEGDGDLNLTTDGALQGSLTIKEGSVTLASSGSKGKMYGTITVEEDGLLITNKDALGHAGGATSVSAITLNKSTWQANTDQDNTGFSSLVITLNDATVTGNARLDFMSANSTPSSVIVSDNTTGNTISNNISLRQAQTEFNVGENAQLTLSGRLGHSIWENTGSSDFSHVLKTGKGTLIIEKDNNFSSSEGAAYNKLNQGGYKGETRVNEGTLQIGNGGSSGTLGQGGKAIVASGAYLAFNRNDAVTIGNVLDGAGTFNFVSGEYTLTGANTLSGVININAGKVLLGSVSALGSGSTVNIASGATLDYNGQVATGTVTVVTASGSTLMAMNGAGHALSVTGAVTGTGGITSASITLAESASLAMNGDMKTGVLALKGENSRITSTGDITVTNGGEFLLSTNNKYTGSGNALVQGGGAVSVAGTFSLNIDSNLGAGEHTYYLFGGTGYSTIGAQLVFANGKEYLSAFYTLDRSVFSTTGTVIINRTPEIGMFVNQADVTVIGATYTPSETGEFLGAKKEVTPGTDATRDNPVVFDADYTVTNGNYQLSDGLGWLNVQTQLTGSGNGLLVSGHTPIDSSEIGSDGHGVILSNNTNDLDGEVIVLDAKVLLDATLGAGAPTVVDGEAINLLGTGDVVIAGDDAELTLRLGGTGDTGTHALANNLTLADGAILTQESGANVLQGDLSIVGTGATLANATEQELLLTGALTAQNGSTLTITGAGTPVLTEGVTRIQGTDADLKNVELAGNARVMVDGSRVSTGQLTVGGGSDIDISNGGELALNSIAKGAESGDSRVILAGGMLTLTGTTSFNGASDVQLLVRDAGMSVYALTAYNTINVSGGQTTINGLGSSDGSFLKIGEGQLILAGDYSSYTGTITTGQGETKLNSSGVYGGSLIAGVDGTPTSLGITNDVQIEGVLASNSGSTVSIAVNGILNGGLSVNGGSFTAARNLQVNGTLLEIGENSKVAFGRDTVIAVNTDKLEIGPNAQIKFGAGSKFTGTITNGVTLENGSTYSGFVNMGANDLTLKSGSVFALGQTELNQYNANGVYITGTGDISVESGVVFQIANGMDLTVAPLFPDGPVTLISTTGGGILSVDGQQVVEDEDYSSHLSATDYAWYSFNLLGGVNELNLEIKKDVQFGNYASTENELNMVDIANSLATKASSEKDELGELATALALSTTSNAGYNLSQMARSVAGISAGYVAQMENLRRHSFELLNRASQEKPGIDRLNYEQHSSTIWVNGLGGSYKLNGDSNAIGSSTNVWGGTLGTSTSVGENAVVGISFTYTNSDTRLDRSMGKAESDAYYLDLFARYRKDNWNVIGVLTGGFTSTDTERDLNMDGYGGRGKGSADGDQIMAMVQCGYEFVVSQDQNSRLEPFVLLMGGYSSMDGYTESGAGNAGLVVDSQSQGMFSAGAGLRFSREYIVDEDEVTKGRFEARALVLQDLGDMEAKVDANFIGRPGNRFHVEGKTPGRTSLIIGMGIVQPLSGSVSLFADVDAEFRSDSSGVGGVVGLKYSF